MYLDGIGWSGPGSGSGWFGSGSGWFGSGLDGLVAYCWW